MNAEIMMKAAIATVGVVQIIKNLVNKEGKVLWTIVTVLVGIGICGIQYLCPAWVMDALITVSGSTLFYDTIVKTFEKMFTKGA